MPYIGNQPAEAYSSVTKDSFSGDGSTTAFTLSVPSTTNDLRVVVENVIQDPTVAYSVSGTTLTFTSAPPTGTNNIYAVNLGPAVQTVTPPAEIGNATTFNSSVTVQGAFTSPGIDDNATSTAMTIDSSGNAIVGSTSSDPVNDGIRLKPAGQVTSTINGDVALLLNRRSSSGTIAQFRQDNAVIGSIGTESTWGSGPQFLGSNSRGFIIANPNTSVNEIIPNVDTVGKLGNSSNRWADLYLSGSVYLGGTGSANALDDYEEGTWTPQFQGSVTNPTVSYSSTVGEYVKIGKLVHVSGRIYVTSSSGLSGNLLIGNLPFTVVCASNTENSPITVGASFGSGWTTTNIAPQGGFVNHNQTRATLIGFDSSDPRDGADTRLTILPANAGMIFSITYYTS